MQFYDGGTLLGTDTSAPYELSAFFDGRHNGLHALAARVVGASGQTAVAFQNLLVDVPQVPGGPVPLSAVGVVVDPSLPERDAPDSAAYPGVVSAVFARHRGEAEFVLLLMNRNAAPTGKPDGYHTPIRNGVSGIGRPVFDRSALLGTGSEVQSIVYFPFRRGIAGGPSLHELAHRWGNDAVETVLPDHFGFSSAGRQLGGFDDGTLKDLGGGLYQAGVGPNLGFGLNANGGNTVPYSDVELYLVGLLAPGEAQPFHVARSAVWVDEERGLFRADGADRMTGEDLIRRWGPRVPDVTFSPKTFRVLTVLLSRTEPTQAQRLEVAEQLTDLTRPEADGDPGRFNFFEATRGRGQLRVVPADHALR